MFARTTSSTLRTTSIPIVRRSIPRFYATSPPEPTTTNKSSKKLIYGAILGTTVAGSAYYYYSTNSGVKAMSPPEITLKGDGEWVDLKLIQVTPVTHNTKKLRFELPSSNHVSGLRIASALLTKFQGPQDDKPTIRPYTPINDEDARGYLDLLVKSYENGPMSTHIHSLTPNQHLSFKGPIPKYEWTPNKHSHIGMVAGGTGITPMYQLIRTIFRNPEDRTKVTLVFGNLTEGDVLLKDELREIENTYPQRFRVVYLLDNAPPNVEWAKQGRVTKELLKEVLPEPGTSENFKIFVCGPPGMYRAVSGTKTSPTDQGELSGILKELGYKKEDVFKF